MKRSFLPLIFALPLLSCGAETPSLSGGDAIAARAITESPPSLEGRDPGELFDVETAIDWSFGGKRKSAGWTLPGEGNRILPKRDRLFLTCRTTPCRLTVDGEIAASEIDAIEVRLAGARSVRLSWAKDGGEVDRERRLTERFLVAGSAATVRFDVAREEGWTGTVSRLELEPVPVPGQRLHAFSVRGLKYRLSDASAGKLAAAPWAVTLADETRPSFLALPGRPFEWQARVPENARLRFGTAVPDTWTTEASFEVVARIAGEERSLFSEQRAPGDGWRDHDVDLASLANREVSFDFRTAGGESEPILGFAAWSSPELLAPSRAVRPNVVLISIDTLRADHLSFAGYERETSPNLDRFVAERGVWLRNTVTSAPWTLPAHVSLVTGLDALAHGVNHKRPMPESLGTLAEQLRAHGYHTLGVTGGGWLSGRYGFDRGFDRYRSWPFGQPRKNELEVHVDQLVDWLPDAPQPFFLFFHTFEVHSPHDRRRPFSAPGAPKLDRSTRFFDSSVEARREAGFTLEKRLLVGERPESARPVESEADWQLAIAAYDNGIRYMDEQIGRLLQALDGAGPTVVVFTSDHGESFGDHDLASHGYLYDDNLLVPLVIALPDESEPGRTIERQVRLVDVAPTILDIAGAPIPDGIDGRSLRKLLTTGRDDDLPRIATSYASSSNFGVALRNGNRLKYIFNNTPWPPIAGAEQLYDLRADPGETQPLEDGGGGDDRARLRSLAATALERRAPSPLLHLRNDGSAVFSGTLAGGCMQPLRVTSPTAGSADVTWVEAGKASFTLDPGESISLALEAPATPCVKVVGRAGGSELEVEIDDPESLEPFGWTLRGSGFESIDDREQLAVGLWWTPAVTSLVAIDPATDEAVRQELEALGYLN